MVSRDSFIDLQKIDCKLGLQLEEYVVRFLLVRWENRWFLMNWEASWPPWPSKMPTKRPPKGGQDSMWKLSSFCWFACMEAMENSP